MIDDVDFESADADDSKADGLAADEIKQASAASAAASASNCKVAVGRYCAYCCFSAARTLSWRQLATWRERLFCLFCGALREQQKIAGWMFQASK